MDRSGDARVCAIANFDPKLKETNFPADAVNAAIVGENTRTGTNETPTHSNMTRAFGRPPVVEVAPPRTYI